MDGACKVDIYLYQLTCCWIIVNISIHCCVWFFCKLWDLCNRCKWCHHYYLRNVGIVQVISARKIQLKISNSLGDNPENQETINIVKHITTQILAASTVVLSIVFMLLIFTVLFTLFTNWILCQTGYLIFYILKMMVILLIMFPLRGISSSSTTSSTHSSTV